LGARSSAQNKITFGGQNGANTLSDRVPTRNAASAPMKYAIATIAALGKVPLKGMNGRRAAALLIADIMTDCSGPGRCELRWPVRGSR
jgi:hypothetical protein